MTPTSRFPSTATNSASNSATMSPVENFRWITVGASAQPDVAIVITNYLNGSPADTDALAALVAKGALNGVHFHSDDLDATFEKLRASGAEIVQDADRAALGHA